MNTAETIITGTVANPSSPSVRLTALADPTMTNIANGKYAQHRLTAQFLKNGNVKVVAVGATVIFVMYHATKPATANSQTSFNLPRMPPELLRDTFR